jgi:flagellar biosynthesis GTPase FlhF
MNQVRLKLGDDALILSSRMIDEGVEIMALAEEIQPNRTTARCPSALNTLQRRMPVK